MKETVVLSSLSSRIVVLEYEALEKGSLWCLGNIYELSEINSLNLDFEAFIA